MGKIGSIRGVFARGSQCLSGIFVGTSCMERSVSRSASSLSGIMHGKHSPGLLLLILLFHTYENVVSLQGATMPAAHMLAMTWFKSTHRSWYFSCYAGKVLIVLLARFKY